MFIKDYALYCEEILDGLDIQEDIITPDLVIKFIHIFEDTITDPRTLKKCTYQLSDILVISFLSLLHGFSNASEFAQFCKIKSALLTKLNLIHDGIYPSHDTFRRIFMIIEPDELNDATIAAVESFFKRIEKELGEEYELIAVDGKTNNGSGRAATTNNPKKNITIVNVYNVSTGLVLKCESCDEKSNEIPKVQTLLKKISLKKRIVTGDAANAQVETVQIIKDKKGEYLFTLKGNHQTFFEDTKKEFDKRLASWKKDNENFYFSKSIYDKRNENLKMIKEYFILDAKNIFEYEQWKGIQKVVLFRKTSYKNGKQTKVDDLYFITSLKSILVIEEVISKRWEVENGLHLHKDKLLDEDLLRFSDATISNNLSIMNNLALVFIKLAHRIYKNISLKFTTKFIKCSFQEVFFKTLYICGTDEIINEMIKQKKKTKN